jgi:DNA polymerase III alpha subunit
VQQLERKLVKRLVNERSQNGAFTNLQDFIARVAPGLEQLLILIRCGAFAFLGEQKSVLLWKAHMFLNKHEKVKEAPMLFAPPIRDYKLPNFEYDKLTDAYDEIELLGFPVSMPYFELLQTNYRGELRAHNLIRYVGRKVRMLGHLVTIKYVKTKNKDYMHFATFVDVDGNLYDSVHFPDSLKRYPFRGDGIYLMYGKVVEEFGYAMIEVEKLAKMPLKANPVME